MSCLFNSVLSGWIRGSEWDAVSSTYGDDLVKIKVERRLHDGTWDRAAPQEGEFVGRKKVYTFIENQKTGDLYNSDSMQAVAFKCFEIAVVTPLYMATRMVFHLCRMVYLVGKIFYESIVACADAIQNGEHGARAFFKHMVVDLSYRLFMDAFLLQLWEVVKAPYYALGLFIAALEGCLYDPMKGKMEIAIIERKWNNNLDRSHDWRIQEVVHGNNCWQGVMNADAFFIGFCMQPLGDISSYVPRPENRDEVVSKYQVIERSDEPLLKGCTFPPLVPIAC